MRKILHTFIFLMVFSAYAQPYQVPAYSVSSTQPAQPGYEIANAIDNDPTTYYHTDWWQKGTPDVVTFYFTPQVKSINKIVYTPRQDGGYNGLWMKVKISYSTQSDPTTFIPIQALQNVNWIDDFQDKVTNLKGWADILKPYAIRYEVVNGYGDFSSCAEMKFYSDEPLSTALDGTDCTMPTASLTGDTKATIMAAGTVASAFQPGYDINNTFDNNPSTIFDSPWDTTQFPLDLNYHFNGTTPIDYLKYIARADGGYNGYFGNVIISYNTASNSTYQYLMTYDFKQNGATTTVKFPNQITPLNIKISIQDGLNHSATCGEMEFYTSGASNTTNLYPAIFTNAMYSDLLPGVTQANINAISDPFYKSLAQCIFSGTYKKRYRVQSYGVYPTLASVSQNLKVGTYDNFENPTGIVFAAGEKVALFANNIPSNASGVYLVVKNFQTGIDGDTSSYPLRNGLNVIQLTNGGMGYISYFDDKTNLNNIDINIVSGKVNGYFDRAVSSNTEWADLLNNTSYPYIDVLGTNVHMVYDKASLRIGSPLDGQSLIAKYDEVVQNERMLMGLYKYNKTPKNHQLVFNEHGNGYYAGGLGVHLDTDWGVDAITNPAKLDLWGIAHELGHINQIRQDLKWIGTTEVTNNIYSAWVDYSMNPNHNPYSRLESESHVPATNIPAIEGGIINGGLYKTLVNGKHLQDTQDYDFFKVLVPFWQLEVYYQLAGASRNAPVLSFNYPTNYNGTDYAHWFSIVSETSRNTNSSNLTNGELLLNFVKNTCDAVHEDLTDFFQKTGFLKPIDVSIDDYGTGQLTITQAQIDQTIASIKAKSYQKPVSPVIHYASANSINMFKNQLPLSGTKGIGVTLNGNYLTVQHSKWQNAVAYETVDSSNKLIYASISGTGDLSNQTTKVYYPSNANAVYAIGFDGQRSLVYPTTLGVEQNSKNSSLVVYPNPIVDGRTVRLSLDNASGDYHAKMSGIDGKTIFTSNGSISKIENDLNLTVSRIPSGLYILTLTDENGKQNTSKLIRQ